MVICPKCRSDRTAPILYGYPSHEAFEAEERGELILGGCEMIDGMPHEDYGCLDCGYRWSKELLPATQITKIRYKVIENGPCTIDSQQSWVYEIYPDGRCKEYTYQGQNRKYQFKTEEKVSEKKVYRLACSLQKIIGAPLWEKNVIEGQVCDGCSYNLQITYADKRKEIINGDVAGGTFDSMLEKFILQYLMMISNNRQLEKGCDEHGLESVLVGIRCNWWYTWCCCHNSSGCGCIMANKI